MTDRPWKRRRTIYVSDVPVVGINRDTGEIVESSAEVISVYVTGWIALGQHVEVMSQEEAKRIGRARFEDVGGRTDPQA